MVVCWCRWTPCASVVIDCVSAGLQNLVTTSKILVLSRLQLLLWLAQPGHTKYTELQHSLLLALCICTWIVESKALLVHLHSVFLLSSQSQQAFSLKLRIDVVIALGKQPLQMHFCLLAHFSWVLLYIVYE